jgi:carboxymethylenebutenolidase
VEEISQSHVETGRKMIQCISRREALYILGMGTAGLALAACQPQVVEKVVKEAVVMETDSSLHTEYVEYPGKTGPIRAHLARPEGDIKSPGVIVIHENRGLTPHIKDVNRRVAAEGFLAMAPDALSPLGGTPEDPDEARSLIGQLDSEPTVEDLVAAVQYLQTHPLCTGKVGCMGFCWGGGVANQLAVHSPDLEAAVPYYGRQPASEDVPKIQASLLLHYAGLDERINEGIPEFKAALEEASVDYRLYMYEGAQHAFNNDTNPDRYDEEAARLAWERTIAFLNEKLKT